VKREALGAMIFDSETVRLGIVCVAGMAFAAIVGIDLGAGTLLRFFKSDEERERVIAVGCSRIWRKFEIWFAFACCASAWAFPRECAQFFHDFLPAFVVLFFAIIFRLGAFFVRKIFAGTERVKKICDTIFFAMSAFIAFSLGVGAGCIAMFSPFSDGGENAVGTANFLDLIETIPLAAGVLAVAIFALHAAIFLRPKTAELVRFKIEMLLPRLFVFAAIFYIATSAFALYKNPNVARVCTGTPLLGIVPVAAIFALVSAGFFLRCRTFKLAFAGTSATLALLVLTALTR